MKPDAEAQADDDKSLLARFVEGDEAAFMTLYERHAPEVLASATRLLGKRRDPDADASPGSVARRQSRASESAQDAAQETWLRFTAGAEDFRGESSVRTWLLKIVFHVCQEMRRKAEREPKGKPVSWERIDGAPSPFESAATAEAREGVRTALAMLPESQRDVVLLRETFGYTFDEIGEGMGIHPKAAQRLHAKGMAGLRHLLWRFGPESDIENEGETERSERHAV